MTRARKHLRIGIGPLLVLAPSLVSALSVGPLIAESVDANSLPQFGFCGGARLSTTGRHMTFFCIQTGLPMHGDPSLPQSDLPIHLFVRDRLSRHTQLVDVDDDGRRYEQSARHGSVSANGRYVVFESASPLIPEFDWPPISPGRTYVYLRDTQAGTTELIARMADGSIPPFQMSQGGVPNFDRSEVLLYGQTDLLSGDLTLPSGSLFVRDWRTGTVERITVTGDGAPGYGAPAVLSADGGTVVFLSNATDLTDDNPQGLPNLFVRDRLARTTRRLSFPAAGGEFQTPVSIDGDSLRLTADGRLLLFSSTGHEWIAGGQSLPYSNVYLMDLGSGEVTLASTGSRGQPPNGASASGRISADGRYLAFATRATNLMDTPQRPGVYVKDRLTGAIVDASASLGDMPEHGLPDLDLSADGSTLAFTWIDGAYPQGDPRRQRMYSAALRGGPPAAEPVAVPSTSWPAWLMLSALLSWLGTVRARTSRAVARALSKDAAIPQPANVP